MSITETTSIINLGKILLILDTYSTDIVQLQTSAWRLETPGIHTTSRARGKAQFIIKQVFKVTVYNT